jgi:hypothetical protein
LFKVEHAGYEETTHVSLLPVDRAAIVVLAVKVAPKAG